MNKAHHVCEIRDAFYPSQSLFGLVFSSFIALHGTTNYGFILRSLVCWIFKIENYNKNLTNETHLKSGSLKFANHILRHCKTHQE